ncbi:FkbM family methyltransferase [Ectothiorhodospira marina]|nr:FkbM family methyltransferase [Ectothiorhodospira marina]
MVEKRRNQGCRPVTVAQKNNKHIDHLSVFCRSFDREYHGIENKIRINGEAWLLEILAPLQFQTIFDVGANVGNWSRIAYTHHAHAQIHAFEVVPDTREVLVSNLKEMMDRVVINDAGLGPEEGSLPIWYEPDQSVLSSALNFQSAKAKQRDCPITTGDAYCKRHGIDRIDLLKIDVEGAEKMVLDGFEGMLEEKAIRLIQFEYNQGAILSKFLLRDFYEFFEQQGYRVARLFPDRVQFKSYGFDDEDFKGPNYLAIYTDDTQVLEALGMAPVHR